MKVRHWALLVGLFGLTSLAHGQSVNDEAAGLEVAPVFIPAMVSATPRVGVQAAISGSIPATGVLLIPESTNDRVMAFDPQTGDLMDADYIPSDPTNLSTPINAIVNAAGDSILVSDQVDNVVQKYDLNGNYVGVFAPAGGVNMAILDNVRGMALLPNGNLLVTTAGGTNADAIVEFDMDGNLVGNFIAPAASPMSSPFDVLIRSNDILVAGINSDAIHRYDLNGAYLDDLVAVNNFPEQLAQIASGNILVGNFSGTQMGVMEFTSTGTLVDIYGFTGGVDYRGVFELGNGNLLTTNSSGVYEIDRSGNLIETKIAGVSARFIELALPKPEASSGGGGGVTALWELIVLLVVTVLALTLFLQTRNTGY